MTMRITVAMVGAVLMAASALAGAPAPSSVPVLGDAGMVVLGLGLAACGLVAFRRRR
jgi:hypothetical protein